MSGCRHGFALDQCGHCNDANNSYERNRGIELCLEASEGYVKDLEKQNAELLKALKKAYQQCVEFLNEGDFHREVVWDAGYIVDAISRAEGRSNG